MLNETVYVPAEHQKGNAGHSVRNGTSAFDRKSDEQAQSSDNVFIICMPTYSIFMIQSSPQPQSSCSHGAAWKQTQGPKSSIVSQGQAL